LQGVETYLLMICSIFQRAVIIGPDGKRDD
jgi:hypothetical protein